MRMSCLQYFEQMPYFQSMCLYTMFLNNELCQYSCLISDRRILTMATEDFKDESDEEEGYNFNMLQVSSKHKSAVIVPKSMEKSSS